MSWIKLDDRFPQDERILALSDKAFRLHVTTLCLCGQNLTDGRISSAMLRLSANNAALVRTKSFVSELVTSGLWASYEDGWTIVSYLKYNPDAASVKQKRAEAQARMTKARSQERKKNKGAPFARSSRTPSRQGRSSLQEESVPVLQEADGNPSPPSADGLEAAASASNGKAVWSVQVDYHDIGGPPDYFGPYSLAEAKACCDRQIAEAVKGAPWGAQVVRGDPNDLYAEAGVTTGGRVDDSNPMPRLSASDESSAPESSWLVWSAPRLDTGDEREFELLGIHSDYFEAKTQADTIKGATVDSMKVADGLEVGHIRKVTML